jgi:putative ABC transport system permease protein
MAVTPTPMFRNNLKIALRSLLNQKAFTLINILGLAVGIASCLVIVLFIRYEFSYDKFLTDHDRIYRMSLERIYPNHRTLYSVVPHSFEAVAKRDFPEIELSCNVSGFPNFPLSYKNERDEVKQFDEDFVVLTDSTFFKMFSFRLLRGLADEVFRNPNDLVVTEEMAHRYFGDDDPIGKTLFSGEQTYKVTGVMENVPDNSHVKFNCLVSIRTFPFARQENFTSFSTYTYFKLKPGADAAALEAKFPKMVDTYAAAQIERELGKSWADYRKEGNGYRYFLQPVTSIYLDPQTIEAEMKPGGNLNTVYIMIVVAALILIIACINFMNLSTARSTERAREVGVRKVMGSFRQQLVFQFLTESFLLSLAGVAVAVAIVYFSLPLFNVLTGKPLALVFTVPMIVLLLAVVAVVGFLAGFYPSLVLSGFNPVVVMKGNFTGSTRGKWIRNGLVIFQFWISIVLLIGTLVIREQMSFISGKSLGFDKEQLLIVERCFALEPQKAKTFVEEVRRLPQVIAAAGTFSRPGEESDYFGRQYQPEGSSEILTTKSTAIADGFAETLGLELAEGRWFSPETVDSLYVILNETAVKVMNIPDPIGKKLMGFDQNQQGQRVERAYTILGVVKDFNFISLREGITPLTLHSNELNQGAIGFTFVRVKPGDVREAIAAIQAQWAAIAPDQAFKFSFLDQNLDAQYRAEEQSGKLFAIFSGLALFVACIGLFALSAYTASLRTKEIGIRKVLGASVTGVIYLLSKDFTRMVLIAFVLAVPVAWYTMEHWWLQSFAYRIGLSAWIFMAAGATALLIAWITVSFQSIKAAVQDPVRSLRSE